MPRRSRAAAAETGGVAIACDVGSEADVERLVAVARARLGRIDAIVSNAGYRQVTAPLAETSLATWNEVLATNLTATFLLAKAAAADLERARGAIVTIASTRAHMSEPNTLAYSASKGGLVGADPCAGDDAGARRAGQLRVARLDRHRQARAPQGRATTPSIPPAASACPRTWRRRSPTCCREEAGFVTGAELIVDGGMTRKMIYT